MKLIKIGYVLATGVAIVVSSVSNKPRGSVSRRDVLVESVEWIASPIAEPHDLKKRKGGGGSSGSSGSSGGRTGSGSGSSGGVPRIGPSYSGGRYYGGGSASAYRAGARSPAGLLPFFLFPVLIFPGLWSYGAYGYNYNRPYSFLNRTRNSNETLPITCLCERYSDCGCDDNTNSTFLDSIIGDGNIANFNTSLVRVSDVNGTKTIVLNGTLPNDTATSTDSDDSDSSPTSSSSSTSAANKRFWLESSGFWVLGALVVATVWMI